jgi:hypothetical protein
MVKVSENPVADQVLKVARDFGYEAKIDPDAPPFRIFGWFGGRRFRPDIIVNHDNRSAIVVAKSRPIMMYDVFLTHQVRGEKDTGALICVPDASFPRIRGSSKEYADELNVRLCRLSEVGDVLTSMLG